MEMEQPKRRSGIGGKTMLVHKFSLVELIFSHGKMCVVVCSYPMCVAMQKNSPLECIGGLRT